jgi:hypothetical protein
VVTAATFALACIGGVVVFNLTFNQPQGRYLFAVLPFLAYLWAAGLDVWLRQLRARWSVTVATAAIVLSAVAIDVASLDRVAHFYRAHRPHPHAVSALSERSQR